MTWLTKCWECLQPIEPGQPAAACITDEDGIIHGVHYEKGTTVYAHHDCLVVIDE